MASPTGIRLRTYHVGFGDCFLLSFDYAASASRHVLIDFGTTRFPKRTPRRSHVQIARLIRTDSGGKLHGVVATHRHADHISGFAGSSGEIIAELQPTVVLQPWTEDPELDPDATAPDASVDPFAGAVGFVGGLAAMQSVAGAALAEVGRRRSGSTNARLQTLSIINGAKGTEDISNEKAVAALIELGRQNQPEWGFHGMTSVIGDDIPGVKIRILGPPTVDQSATILKQRSTDANEYWHLQANGRDRAARTTDLFPGVRPLSKARIPVQTRWMRDQLHELRDDQLMEIVRTVDDSLNNTSLILLIEVGRGANKKRLLFPGDAQIENWSYTLTGPGSARLLADLAQVDFYKVGHHGSLNGTPKTLWNGFEKRGPQEASGRMLSVMSTKGRVHGSHGRKTEVPRTTLKKALEAETEFFTTQDIRGKRLVHELDL